MNSRPMRRGGAILAVLLAVVLAAAGCTRTVSGQAIHATGGVKDDAPPSDLAIENGDGGKIDQLVANSMDDILKYWDGQFEEVFDEELEPLQGGIHAYEPDDSTSIPCISPSEKQSAANNAYYCFADDAIAYDRAFVGQLVDLFGEFIVPLVFAHEVGHAIQGRVGRPTQKTISSEGQADCYAGVFTKEATEGTTHFKASNADIDAVLAGYLTVLRDEPGASADDDMAHGSAFDRVGAFQEGFNEGPSHCYTSFGSDREYTEIPYFTQNDFANQGNLPYDQTLDVVPEEMNSFGETVVGADWDAVQASGYGASAATCDGKKVAEQVFYCADDETVHFAEQQLVQQAYDKFGDFAAMSAIALGYADAILAADGSKTSGQKGFQSRLCLVGAYAGGAFEATVSGQQSPLGGGLQLSAGDLDEAVMLLIAVGEDDQFIKTYDLDAFERINIFREAVLEGRTDAEGAVEGCLA